MMPRFGHVTACTQQTCFLASTQIDGSTSFVLREGPETDGNLCCMYIVLKPC